MKALNESDHFIRDEEECLDNKQQDYNPVAFSVKKFISQPNPLMSKIQFTSYVPNQHYPVPFQKLPSSVTVDTNSVSTDKNNMQLLEQTTFRHQKMKKDIVKAIYGKVLQKDSLADQSLPTLDQYYRSKQLVFDKFRNNNFALLQSQKQNTQGQSNTKETLSKGMATYVMDVSSIVKKKPQKPQTASLVSAHGPRARTTRSHSMNYRPQIKSQVEFNSNFETGNLCKAYNVGPNEYDLILQNDVNTKGNNQWFFFSVKGVPKGNMIKFNIVNFNKRSSLFEDGMKPTVFSMVKYEKRKIGWIRDGMNISYDQNPSVRREFNSRAFYSLTFSYKFIYEGDVVYFSHSYPYTLTNLSNYISNKLEDKSVHKLVKFRNIATTLGGNDVDLLQISDQDEVKNSSKKIVWIMGRQHPGQVSGSFMVQGIIDFLLSKKQISTHLLRQYVWKIVPMVNVDGVIHGNSRAEIIGCDPNRKWQAPHKIYNPVIYAIRKAIERDKGRVQMVLDLHSHSRKLGTFFYGNTMSETKKRNLTKVFPMMVCKKDQRFRFQDCRFGGGNNLTARRVLFDKLQIPLIYTIESSFYGYQKNDHRIIPYYPRDYKEMAKNVIQTFFNYQLQKNQPKTSSSIKYMSYKANQSFAEDTIQDQMKTFFSQLGEDAKERLDQDSDGSNSNPSQDQFSLKQLKKLLPKTFNIKTKPKKAPSKIKKKSQKKQNKEETQNSKSKKIMGESHYKKYFTSRNSQLQEVILSREPIPKQLKSFGVQVDLLESSPLRQFVNTSSSERRVSTGNGALCILGKRLEEDLLVCGTTVGVQVDQKRDLFRSRNQLGSGTRRSFKLPCRPSSILQIKENNFLNRGNCGHLATQFAFFKSRA